MFNNLFAGQRLETMGSLFGLFILALVVWSLYWKGRGLWNAARSEQKGWFVALLLINTVGILEILYLYVFSKKAKMETIKQ